MNDIRRIVLWVIFIFALVLLVDKWQIHNGKQPIFFPTPAVTAPADGSAKPADASLPKAVTPTAGAGDVPGGVAAPATAAVPRRTSSSAMMCCA